MKAEQADILLTVSDLSEYLSIKPTTLYGKVEAGEIPSYKIGRLVRFRQKEIDNWLELQRRGSVVGKRNIRKFVAKGKSRPEHIDKLIERAIDDVVHEGYNQSHGKPDHVKGLGKEVAHGPL